MSNLYLSVNQKDKKDATNPVWYKNFIGGMWEEVGELQFNFLLKTGLKPHHQLLDLGCGSLRGGIHFIKYLQKNNYWGTDIRKDLLLAGNKEIEINKL